MSKTIQGILKGARPLEDTFATFPAREKQAPSPAPAKGESK